MLYIQDRKTLKLIPASEYYADKVEDKHHFIIPDTPGYVSPVTGLWVEGRKQRKADLERSGARPWEGLEAEKKEAARMKEYVCAQEDREVKQAVEQAFRNSPERIKRMFGA